MTLILFFIKKNDVNLIPFKIKREEDIILNKYFINYHYLYLFFKLCCIKYNK